MCYYTKFPEAIPLKRVDTMAVMDAMCEVFSRYGLPQSMLTDQGSVFMSKVVKGLCQTWEIDHIRTSPYHPQSDGALERWHACLKGMLKKQPVEGNRWDEVLKFCLFTYRDSPHCVTGFLT